MTAIEADPSPPIRGRIRTVVDRLLSLGVPAAQATGWFVAVVMPLVSATNLVVLARTRRFESASLWCWSLSRLRSLRCHLEAWPGRARLSSSPFSARCSRCWRSAHAVPWPGSSRTWRYWPA